MPRRWISPVPGLVVTTILASGCGAASTPAPTHIVVAHSAAALPAPKQCSAPTVTPPSGPGSVPAAATKRDVQATIGIGNDSAPGSAAGGFGSIWVVAYRGEYIARIDPHSNAVVASIPLPRIGGQPVASARLVVGAHGVWLPISESSPGGQTTGGSPNQLLRIDPSTNTISMHVEIESLYGVIDGVDGLWAGVDPQNGAAVRKSILELDPSTGRTLRSVDLGPASASPQYHPEIDDGLGSLWAVIADDAVARVDPASGRVTATIHTPSVPSPSGFGSIDFAGEHMFIGDADSTIARVDASTNCVDGIAHVGQSSQLTLVSAPDGLYVGFDQGALALVDPMTLIVHRSVRLDHQDFIGGPASGFGSIWFPTFGNNTVLRVLPLA